MGTSRLLLCPRSSALELIAQDDRSGRERGVGPHSRHAVALVRREQAPPSNAGSAAPANSRQPIYTPRRILRSFMEADLTVRLATLADAEAIARVHVESWRAGYRGLLADELLAGLSLAERESMWRARLDGTDPQHETRRVEVAVARGSIAGFLVSGPSEEWSARTPSGEIYAIYVHPEHWSAGVGQALIGSAVDHLAGIGAGEALLWVLASNARARRFYKRAGWVWDGRSRTKRLTGVPDFASEVEEVCYWRRLPHDADERACRIELTEGRWLRLLEEPDAQKLYAVIDANRDHLVRWMPWAAGQTPDDTLAFIQRTREQLANNDGFQTAVIEDDRIVGVAGFHGVSWDHRSTSIGYWLAASAQGRGTMTHAVRALLDHAFGTWRLHRVEIRAAVDNARSRAIPERLGFTQEGVAREAEQIGGRYVDQVVYAMLAGDWFARDHRSRSIAASAAMRG